MEDEGLLAWPEDYLNGRSGPGMGGNSESFPRKQKMENRFRQKTENFAVIIRPNYSTRKSICPAANASCTTRNVVVDQRFNLQAFIKISGTLQLQYNKQSVNFDSKILGISTFGACNTTHQLRWTQWSISNYCPRVSIPLFEFIDTIATYPKGVQRFDEYYWLRQNLYS